MVTRFLIPCLFLICHPLRAHASGRLHFTTPEYVIHVWETKDGLPENSATAMAQTPDGYLWFGTFNGLVRFDGVEMKVLDRSNTPELPSAAVINVYADKAGRLWASTAKGMACRETNGIWRSFGREQGWSGGYAKSFTEDKNGQLVCGTDDKKIFRIAGGKVEEIPTPPDIPRAAVFCYYDSEGVLWLAGRRFLGYWNRDRWERTLPENDIGAFKCATPSRDGGLWYFEMNRLRKFIAGKEAIRLQLPPQVDPWSLYEDSHGSVWIAGYYNGVFRHDTQSGWTHFSSTNGLTYNASRFVFEDNEGTHWVGTSGGGLHRFKRRLFQSFAPDDNEFQLGRVIKSVAEPTPGHFLVCTYGEGILKFENGVFTKSGLPPISYHYRTNCFPTPYIANIAGDLKGNIWIASLDSLIVWDGNTNAVQALKNQDIYAILRDSRGRMWSGGNKGLASSLDGREFTFYGRETGLTATNIFCLADDPKNNRLWVGTDDGGLFCHENGSFRRFSMADGLASDQIRSLHIDSGGGLWVGTLDKGLARYSNSRFVMIGEGPHLLSARQINTILEDDEDFLWLGSNRGIIRAHRRDLEAVALGQKNHLKSRTFDYNDGLLSIETSSGNQSCGLRDSAGRLWFCTMKGLAMVDPSQFQTNKTTPRIHIEALEYYVSSKKADSTNSLGQTGRSEELVRSNAPFAGKIELPAGSRRIEFHYTGLNFSAPEKVLYQYMLEGQDAEWIEAGNRRVAYYHELPPGEYRFHVRVIDENGVSSRNDAQLAISINAHYWQRLWFQALLVTLFGAGVAGTVAIMQQNKLIRREREAALTQNASDVVTLMSADGFIIYESPSASRLFGYPNGHLLGKNPMQFMHPDDLPAVRESYRQILAKTNPGVPLEFRFRHAEDHWIDVESVGVNLLDQKSVRGILVTTRNITERKRAEAIKAKLETQLRQAQKMEALGTLAGGIAHDFNNMLAAITGFTELARSDAQNHPEILDSLTQIGMASDRATDLVRQILAFSRQGKNERKPLRLQFIVKECLKMLSSTLPVSIEIVSNIEPKPLVILADPTQIHQVLMNLCINAAHAMQSKPGRLSVTLDAFVAEGEFSRKHPNIKPGAYARLVVADTGHGMNEETLNRIFDPFFTTKAQGEGTGLGLAVVQGIVNEHDGAIVVESQPEVGTTFQLFFPAHENTETKEESVKKTIPRGHGEHVLYVDDETALCESARQLLQNLGYMVTIFSLPTKALAHFKQQPKAFDVVVTDLSMPGMSGVDFAMELLKVRPDTPVILTSGFAGTWTHELAKTAGIREIILKPVSSDRLGIIIDQLLHPQSENFG